MHIPFLAMEFSPPIVPNMNLIKDEITSPLSAQILEFSESELFPDTIHQNNSEVDSSSNCGYEEHSSYSTNLPLTPDMITFNGAAAADTKDNVSAANNHHTSNNNTAAGKDDVNNNHHHLSIIFDTQEDIDNLSASIDFGPDAGAENFSVPPPQFLHHSNQLDQFDISSLDNIHQIAVGEIGRNGHHQQYTPEQLMGPPQSQAHMMYEEECLSSVPSYLRLTSSSPNCSLLDHALGSYNLPGNLNPSEHSGMFTGAGGFYLGGELPTHQEMEFQGDNSRVFCPDSIQRIYNCTGDQFQTLSNESQHLVNGGGNSTPLASDVTCLEDTTFKVGKLSVEERKEKIHRYLKKRNERNFSKKIKYACRKTLADSRPRVRGRFAKNDDFGDVTIARPSMGTHHEDDTNVVDEAARHHNFLYGDPNNYHAAALSHGGGRNIFNSNCLAPPGATAYDMCTLFCADANMN